MDSKGLKEINMKSFEEIKVAFKESAAMVHELLGQYYLSEDFQEAVEIGRENLRDLLTQEERTFYVNYLEEKATKERV